MKLSLVHHGLGDWEVGKSSFSRLNGARQLKILADVMADRARSLMPHVATRLTLSPSCPHVHVLKRRIGRVLALHSHSSALPPCSLSLASASPLSCPRHARANRSAVPSPPHLHRAHSQPPPRYCPIAHAHCSAITSSTSLTTHCLNPSQGKRLRASSP